MAEAKKDLTVIIASSENKSVFDCIDSVRGKANIVVSLTPFIPIEDKLSRLGIPYVVVPRGNLGLTYNAGIDLAPTNKVIIMDDDVVFSPGAIDKLGEGLERYDGCKARLSFRYNSSALSRAIANARDYINSSQTRVFTPGLALNKGIKEKMGGHYFDEEVRWAEDAEFSYRFHKNGLSFGYVEDAVVTHPPVSLKHDLRGAFLIGLSKRRSVELGLREGSEDLIPTMKRFISGEAFTRRRKVLESKGINTLLYMTMWDLFYNSGYNLRKLGLSTSIEEKIWKDFGRDKK